MDGLRLAARGLRWRLGSSIAIFLVSVVALAGAALGPLYAQSAQASLVRDALSAAPAAATGVQSRGTVAGQTQYTPAEVLAAVQARAENPVLDPWFGTPTLSLVVKSGAPSFDGSLMGVASVAWHRGQCEAVVIVEGTCADAAGEAMLSQRTADQAGVAIGDSIQLGVTGDTEKDRATVVGTYDQTTADASAWGLASPDQFRLGAVEGAPDFLDEVVVGAGTLDAVTGDVSAVSLRPIDPASVSLGDLDALVAAVAEATALPDLSRHDGPRASSESGLVRFVDELRPRLDAIAAASLAVTVQLVLLAWFVLFLLVAAATEERSGEIALAQLRGHTRASTASHGLAEPLTLLVLAAPVGLAAALALDTALAARFLGPGATVSLTWATFAALIVGVLGGAIAAALAARRILTAPVLDQLRRTSSRRSRILRSGAIDAVAVALAVAASYQLLRGGSDVLALIAPGLIALAAGLLAARVLPRAARRWSARTRGTSNVAAFLAARSIERRPSGLRAVVLLAMSVGLVAFAIDGWVVVSADQTQLARATVGSHTVLIVRAPSAGGLLDAVRTVDPDGTLAMAVVTTNSDTGGLIAVDSQRLAAVSAWDPAWAGSSAEAIAGQLHPAAAAAPIPVHGRLALTTQFTRAAGDATVLLNVAVRAASGTPVQASLGPLSEGEQQHAVDLPVCREDPCTLTAFTFTQPIGEPASDVTASVTLDAASDAEGPVDLAAPGPAGWAPGAAAIAFPIAGGAEVAWTEAGAVSLRLTATSDADGAIQVLDHPLALPVVLGGPDGIPPSGTATVGGLDGRPTLASAAGIGVLPRLLRSGTMADLPYALGAMGGLPGQLGYQVWLSGTPDPALLAQLSDAGIVVTSTQTVADAVGLLERTGASVALRLFVVAALLALALAAGALLAQSALTRRRRAYELAGLRTMGAAHRLLVRAGRREQAVLALAGIGVGVAAGVVAGALAMPVLLGEAIDAGPTPWLGPAWLAVATLTLGSALLMVVVADIGARRTARAAELGLLRQVQE